MTERHRHLVLCTQTNPTGKQVAELGDLSAMYRDEGEHTHLVLGVHSLPHQARKKRARVSARIRPWATLMGRINPARRADKNGHGNATVRSRVGLKPPKPND